MILASKEDYAGAQENLQSYLKFAPRAPDADVVKKQLAEIQGRVAQAKPE
jgi:regulator of sirC expression with transglutaminase-like and TPR domain